MGFTGVIQCTKIGRKTHTHTFVRSDLIILGVLEYSIQRIIPLFLCLVFDTCMSTTLIVLSFFFILLPLIILLKELNLK